MSLVRSDYILIGLNVGYEKYNSNRFEEYAAYMDLTTTGDITYLVDVDGDYFIVGEIIKCDPKGYDGLGLNTFPTINDTPFIEKKERVRMHIREKFKMDGEPKLIVLTHWT